MTPPLVPARPAPGESVEFRWRKWDGGEHWVHDCVFLGSDEWGDWVGQRAGLRSFRPGRDLRAERDNVTLIPPTGEYAMTVNADAPGKVRIYIDIAWDVRWSEREPAVVEGIDMDLDVVLDRGSRGLFIDDRDEWEEHRVRYGYPLDLVDRLESVAVDLEQRVRAAEAPFDDATPDAWLARLRALGS